MDDTTNNTSNNNNSTSPLPADMVACEQCGKPEHKTKLKKKRFCSPTCARQAKASIGEQVAQAQQQQQQQLQAHQQQQQQQNEAINNSNINNLNDANNTNHLNNSINMELNNSLTAPMVSVNTGMVERMQTDNSIMSPSVPIVTTAPQLQMQQPPVLSSSSSANIPAVISEAVTLAPQVAATAAPAAVEQQPQMANWTVSDVCEFIKNLPGCSDYVDDFEQQEIDGQALLLLKENHLVNAMGMKLGPALKIVAKVESMKEVSAAALNAANNAMEGNNASTQ